MNILVLTDEVWNDDLYTNNVLTNWFSGIPCNIANIYLASGRPNNPCCHRYFQITDKMMIKSIITKRKAGISFMEGMEKAPTIKLESKEPRIISFFRNHPLESLRLIKDLIWLKGSVDVGELEKFIKDFNPDIIFSLRMASLKVLAMEQLVRKLAKVPLVCFTGDDEYSLGQIRVSPIYWFRRILIRSSLRDNVRTYERYYTLSKEQAEYYGKIFGIETKVIRKCIDINKTFKAKEVNDPIRIVYAGRLYCKRDKTLRILTDVINSMNEVNQKVELEIYTKDTISKLHEKFHSDRLHLNLKPPVDAKKLKEIYEKADIALHVESFDLKNRLLTRYSFSTKIIDCLGSSCAVLAIGPKKNAGINYLKEKNAAICITKPQLIENYLNKICSNKNLLKTYQKKAWRCVRKYHLPSIVQGDIIKDFDKIVTDYQKKHKK